MHQRNVCTDCNTITVGTAHEKLTHGNEAEITHLHAQTEAPAHKKKGWIQQKKTFINRKVKKLINEIKKDGNIYNDLNNIPEKPDIQKIKQHFSKTVTTQHWTG